MKLNAAEWARVEALFPQAADLRGGERERFLQRECSAEPRIRAELEAMLEAAGGGDALFDAPVALAAGGPEPDRLTAGTRLGPWKVRSLLGHGGMGEVYLAERADGAYAMNAAIKLLKRELFSFDNAQRFLRERRVLARLSHPNIARALDAGTTDDGRPYLVMEYVDGLRVTEYARAQQLVPRAAAGLLLAVADAVAEAHRNGVVHRDLKPANVLVTHDQNVKLLDFGIARLLDEAESPAPVAMTPAYAAPEQIRGQALTPATDVYALGVLFYQLLTRRLPHRREGLPLPVIVAGLEDETVERPSRVVLTQPGLFAEGSRRRRALALAGDLDWIALKALQTDPQRRYATAGALADDLRRYLAHLPVRARPDTLPYRASRFVRRYPTQVAATAVALAGLVGGLAAALWEAHSARAESSRASRASEFVLALFREQDPAAQAPAETLPVRTLLARGLARAEAELADDPDLQAQLLADLGEVQAALGDPRGRLALERALAAQRALQGEASLASAATLRRLALALEREGRLAEAAARTREARAILEAHDALEGLEAGRLEMRAGFVADRLQDRGDAPARHFRGAQVIFERELGPDAPDTLYAIYYRADALTKADRDAEAVALLREAIARAGRSAGVESTRIIALCRLRLAETLIEQGGAADEAATLLDQALGALRTPGDGSRTLAHALLLRASLHADARESAQARPLLEEAIHLLEALPEPGNDLPAARLRLGRLSPRDGS